MKIQSLGIIFILIVLPITIVLAEYSQAQLKTATLEAKYDSALITATYDALKAFQINTFNDPYADIADRKISSIEASASAFYNSIKASLGMQGYSMEDIQLHTPALVYTMYDGYYIYSPYTNIAKIIDDGDDTTPNVLKLNLSSDNIQFGFKPYIYYSCRYVVGTDSDFVITYSLDNYISIVGMVKGNYVNDAGYLISPETLTKHPTEEKYYYDGIEIQTEAPLKEYIIYTKQDGTADDGYYEYVKINGTKYYLEGYDETSGEVFHIVNGRRKLQVSSSNNLNEYKVYYNAIKNNNQGKTYYKDAYEFTKKVLNTDGNSPYGDVLKNLSSANAVDKGEAIDWKIAEYKIFADSSTDTVTNPQPPIEYPNSNFNEQRKAVIRYSIESNLSVAIANFNAYSNSNNDFQMPKLKDTDWELLQNQVSIISFLQGLNIGGKIYNGYTVIVNDKTGEVVKEENIYITTNDNYYHKINDKHLQNINVSDLGIGVLNTDFQVRKDTITQKYYYPKKQLGCYTGIVSQNNLDNQYDSIYEYLKETNEVTDRVKKLYYTALGRERWGTYKVSSKVSITINDLIEGGTPETPVTPDLPEDPVAPEVPVDSIYPGIIINDIDGVANTYSILLTEDKAIIRKTILAVDDNEIASVKYVINRIPEIPTDDAGWIEIANNSIISYTVNKTDLGTYYIHVKATDGVGNITTISREYVVEKEVDGERPTVVINDIDGISDIYVIGLTETQVTINKQITASDNHEIESIKYIISRTATMPEDAAGWTEITNGAEISYTVNETDLGTYYIHVKVKDKSGNEATLTKTYSIEKEQIEETIIPTISINDIDGRTSYKTAISTWWWASEESKLNKTITVEGTYSQIQYVLTKESEMPITGWTTYDTSSSITKTFETRLVNSDEGTWYLYVRVLDSNGNVLATQKASYTVVKISQGWEEWWN